VRSAQRFPRNRRKHGKYNRSRGLTKLDTQRNVSRRWPMTLLMLRAPGACAAVM